MAATPVAASQSKTMTLSELRVFELKQELEKRGLDKSGIKLALVERLEEALREEGHDPKIYKFVVNEYGKSLTTPSKSSFSETLRESQFNCSTHGTLSEHGIEVSNGHDENEQQEIKREGPSEPDTAIGIITEFEDSNGAVEKADHLTTAKESSEELVEGKKVKHNQMEETSTIKREDRSINELIEGRMEVNEVVEDTSIVKEVVETKQPEEEEIVKEIADEVNYEDEEMPDRMPDQINEEEGETEECKETGSKMTEKENESKTAEKVEVKVSKDGENLFKSTVETVASTPVEHIDGAPHAATSMLKKSDNSLWIKGISPNTKAADLKALFAKYGRVLTAKIFTRRQQPSNACFGFVTMVDSAAADLCIQKLHKTNIKGRPITVERADRCNMPIVKSIPKKPACNVTGDVKSGKSAATFDTCSKSGEEKLSTTKAAEKLKKDTSSTDKSKSSTSSGSKGINTTRNEKQKAVKAMSETKKSPVKAPSTSTTHSRFSTLSSSKRSVTHLPSRFRSSKRIERTDRVSSTLRRSYVIRKPSYSSAASRRTLGSRPFSSRIGRGSILRGMVRREVSSRRVEPPTSWAKREMIEMLRKKEEEHRLKEQELRLQRERERLKFERERFERERLELQQLRQIAALTTPVQMMSPSGAPPPSRRSHEYGDMDSSRYKSEKELKRNEYSRRSRERSSSHRGVTSTRNSLPDRREAHSSSRHVSTHSSSRVVGERSHERNRDRSRHSTRDYGSSNVVRESGPSYGRESHSYSRSGDPTISSSYGRDPYRPDSTTYNSHRSSDTGYGSRDIGTYSSSSTYSRDVAPSSYNKDSGYGPSSRSLGGGTSWSVGSSSSTYVGSSRDYDGDAWVSGAPASQAHGSHGLGSSNWSSSRDDHWSGGGMTDTHGHVSTYDKYDKYDSYDKYNRRY
ncbi:scaffold attachment factor B [Loa loa]|uniref:Scaffold attachment factor B n=1 Tax=Loa loa TaxID=7209 RepID=A0A1I7VVB1_LOALO|nr:scaffold attachment factor B [Loa loa]EFO28391.2 scaffold attachment factor B [Loa loa]